MKLHRNLEAYVSGSVKDFAIYKCTVDEVDEEVTDSGKHMMSARIGVTTFKGLFDQAIYDMMCLNEGVPSFVVLWLPNHGNPMLAYTKKLWTDAAKELSNEANATM